MLKPTLNQDTVIFQVSKIPYEDKVIIEPIVIIHHGHYTQPAFETEPDLGNTFPSKSFMTKYYRVGQQYRLFFGGGEAGSVTVKEHGLDLRSWSIPVRLQSTVRVGVYVNALATNSHTLGRKQGARRALTKRESAAMFKLMHAVYRKHGVPLSAQQDVKTFNLTATDLDGDGKYELIGSFRIVRPEAAYNLFLIAEPNADHYRMALANYRKIEAFQTANIDYNEIDPELLIDQIDLDGDGVAEIITQSSEDFQSLYFIYKKQQGKWRSVYRGNFVIQSNE